MNRPFLNLAFVAMAWSAAISWAVPAIAQKAPELGYVFPPAIQIGSDTKVTLGGYDFTSDMQFFVHDEHVQLATDGKPGPHLIPPPPYWFGEKGSTTAFPIPREMDGVFTVDAQARPGLVRWQVANANGSAACAVVYASNVPELTEDRWRDAAQSLPPLKPGAAIGVNGRLARIAEVDRYLLQVTQNGPLTIDLFARRLGSDFHGVMEVRDGVGQVVADCADTEGRDAQLTFLADISETYELRLYDVDYSGNRAFVYRLEVQSGPRVVATIPASLAPGETRDVTFVGWGLRDEASGSLELQTLKQQVAAASDATKVWEHTLKTPFGATRVALPITTTPELELPESADDRGQEIDLGRGGVITMTLPAASSTDLPTARFRVECQKGKRYRVQALSQALGGVLDLSARIEDSEQKVVASNDDASASVIDPSLEFGSTQDGTYICVVEDLSGRLIGEDSVFQLSIAAVTPDFALTAPQQIQLPIGGKAALKVTVARHGFDGEIQLEVDGLPASVTVPEKLLIAAKKNAGTITFECSEKAAATAAKIRIRGRAVIPPPQGTDDAEQTLIRPMKAVATGSLSSRSAEETHQEDFLLTTTMKPRYKVLLIDKNRQRAVHRGTTYPAPFVIEREEGYSREVHLVMAAKQSRHRQGIWGPVLSVPAGETEALYPCHLPEWLATDRTTRMIVLGVALDKDPKGNLREVTQPSDARITMILEGALLRIAHEAPEMTVPVGGQLEIPFRLSRSKKLPLDVKVEIIAPPEIADLLKSEPLMLSAQQSTGVIEIATEAHERLKGSWDISVRATAMQDNRWPVVSATKVTVEFR